MPNTLSTIAALTDRLFAEAEQSNQQMRQLLGNLPPEERARRMSDPNSDYRQFFSRVSKIYMAVSPETARLLYMLARGNGARAIVEFGTSFGVSTIHLAAALRDNGGGTLIGTELEPTKAAQARTNLRDAGLAELVDIREGDAMETLARDLPATVDVLLLDGHKPLYLPIFELVAPRLRPGSYIIADNADASPAFVARLRRDFVSLPFNKDVEVAVVP